MELFGKCIERGRRSMIKNICDDSLCTACGACENSCNFQAIIRTKRKDDSWYMQIDDTKCKNCNRCLKVCPNNHVPSLYSPQKAYAAWSTDKEIHRNSASGGIAAELYNYAVEEGMYFAGVSMDKNLEAHFELVNNKNSIKKFQNSKYTFSYMDDIYLKCKELLKQGEKILFVGLPCQIAGLKNYIGENENLVLIDLAYHGTPSPEFLKQHVKTIEKKKNKIADNVSFRNARFNTNNFYFTLTHKNRIFYKKNSLSEDNYQIGYHKAFIYRDCCYQCRYAQRKRTGDLTIADYHGLGKVSVYNGNKESVSCVLVNSEKGKTLLNKLFENEQIEVIERPLLEPLQNEPQFNYPSKSSQEHDEFINLYQKKENFDLVANVVFKQYKFKGWVLGTTNVVNYKNKFMALLPWELKQYVKKMLRRK